MSSLQPVPAASLLDKIFLISIIGKVLTAALYRALTLPITSTAKANRTLKDIVFSALRTQLGSLNVAQEQWLNAASTTDSTYLDFAKKANFQPDTDVLESGLKVHWLGPKSAAKTILYFHGGGYALACSSGHLQWLFDLQSEVAKSKSVSVALVSYTLTPRGQYPLQLQQAAETLKWLLEVQGKKAGDVSVLLKSCYD